MGKNSYNHNNGSCELSVSPDPREVKQANAPERAGGYIIGLPSWVPSGLDLYKGPAMWEYECQECKTAFKLPVPKSPSDEKYIKCTRCGSANIKRLTALIGEASPYCG